MKSFASSSYLESSHFCNAVFNEFEEAIITRELAQNVYHKEQFISAYELDSESPPIRESFMRIARQTVPCLKLIKDSQHMMTRHVCCC